MAGKTRRICLGLPMRVGLRIAIICRIAFRDHATRELAEFKFANPHAQYLLAWGRDSKEITDEESRMLADYVKEGMEDFTSQGEQFGPGTQTKIMHMLLPSRESIVMAYDELALLEEYEGWEDFAGSESGGAWVLSENAGRRSLESVKWGGGCDG